MSLTIVAEGDDEDDFQIIDEDDMGKVDISEREADEEVLLGKPTFRIGDAVCVTDDLNGIWVVREVIVIYTGETAKYMYEVCLPFFTVFRLVREWERG